MPDNKLTALTADTTPTSDDLTYVVNDPAGTPGSKKVTLANVITKAHGLSDSTVVGVASGVLTSGTDVAVVDGGTGASNASGARTNLGLVIGTDVAPVTSPTLVTPAIGEATGTGLTLSGLTASEIVITNGSKKLVSAAVATYPSLTELTYVKGVTSAIQTQIDGKQASDADLTTIASLTATSDNILQSASSAWASRTPAQVTATLPVFVPDTGSGGAKGLAPATAAGDATKFLKGDGTWAAIPGGGDALVANPLSQFAATTSLQLKGVISDETGSGALVFADTPTLVTPVLGVATATSINKMAITAPASSSTLVVADGKTFTASNTITLTGTDTVSMNISNNKIRTVGWSVDGGGSAITTGQKGGYPVVPFAGTITGYKITADTGTCTVKFWKIASGTAIPTVSNNINTSGVSLSSGTAIISSTTSDFTTTTVTANDIFALNITAISGVTKLFVELQITAS